MADDLADILGNDSLPVRREFSPSAWSAMSLLKYTGWALGAVVTYVVLVLGWNSFSRARERSYRLCVLIALVALRTAHRSSVLGRCDAAMGFRTTTTARST